MTDLSGISGDPRRNRQTTRISSAMARRRSPGVDLGSWLARSSSCLNWDMVRTGKGSIWALGAIGGLRRDRFPTFLVARMDLHDVVGPRIDDARDGCGKLRQCG